MLSSAKVSCPAFKSAMPLKYTDGGPLCNSLGGIGNTPINNKHLSYNAADRGPNGEDFPNKLIYIYGIYSMITTEEYDKKGASGHADLLFTDSKGLGNCPFYCFFNLPIQRIDIWIVK